MKASETELLKFLHGPKQFMIPIYQRTYSWTLKQCEQLWSDIERAAKDETISGHFVGSIVYIEKGLYHHSSIPQSLVIDGQQRLTTITLFLSALGKALEDGKVMGEITQKKINNYYLFNAEEEDDLRYKLLLTQSDKDTLINLIEDRDLTQPVSRRVVDNYQYFTDQIKKSSLGPLEIYKGIEKLVVVDIALNREHDNPQLIFESLNSTGLELSQADLIRNYVLMGLETDEQTEVYKSYWYPMEQSFGQANYVTHFDRFMRDYLTIKTPKIPNIRQVYDEFKVHALSGKVGSIENIVSDIHKFSKYFVNWALQQESDGKVAEAILDINSLKVDVAYPFLLELYDDFTNDLLNKDELLEILRLIESYVFRRSICGIPTNSLNKTFATLMKEIDKDHYLDSFKAIMLLKDSYRRFPDDEEFKSEFINKDVYNFQRRNYMLRKLENHDNKEKVDVESCTIEHIMPQNMTEAWKSELGDNWADIHSKYLHTLGNLTLTAYNSEMSDRPFIYKRDIKGGFADSRLKLNQDIANLDHWTEETIKARAHKLTKTCSEIWGLPSLDEDILEKYRKTETKKPETTYTIADHPHLTGSALELFEILRKHIMNLDAIVTEDILKLYIAFKAITNFVDVIPQKDRLKLSLNIPFNEINDPKGICKDVTGLGRWGNGDVEVILSNKEELSYMMSLVRQSFERQVNELET